MYQGSGRCICLKSHLRVIIYMLKEVGVVNTHKNKLFKPCVFFANSLLQLVLSEQYILQSVYSLPLYKMAGAISVMVSCPSSPSMQQWQCYHPLYLGPGPGWSLADTCTGAQWSQWSPVINKIVITSPAPAHSSWHNRFTLLGQFGIKGLQNLGQNGQLECLKSFLIINGHKLQF